MIVRILAEGQFDVPDDCLDELNELDRAVEQAVSDDDEVAFRTALLQLLDRVRARGREHELDSLDESDLILPGVDATLDEVRELLSDDGLIPG